MKPNKTAIVTGSATGVGAAVALMLAGRGWNVTVNYSKSEREARESEARCRAAGADTLLCQGDVSDDAACRRVVQATLERWGRLDALVNNAGVTTFVGSANWDALDAAAFARAIYAELHQCDEAGAELIVVEALPDAPEWRAIADRLRRAAA